jgi:hypothetical protein
MIAKLPSGTASAVPLYAWPSVRAGFKAAPGFQRLRTDEVVLKSENFKSEII